MTFRDSSELLSCLWNVEGACSHVFTYEARLALHSRASASGLLYIQSLAQDNQARCSERKRTPWTTPSVSSAFTFPHSRRSESCSLGHIPLYSLTENVC